MSEEQTPAHEKAFQRFLKGEIDRAAIKNVPAEYYHSHTGLISKHMLDTFNANPERYKYEIENPEATRDDSPALRFGEAFHTLVLEPKKFKENYVEIPDTIKVRRGKAYEEFALENAGKTLLLPDEMKRLKDMFKALRSNETARGLLYGKEGVNELTMLFHCEEANNRACKARADRVLIDDRTIIDLKTTANASPKDFVWQVARFRYDVQAAFYIDAAEKALTLDGWRFAIVAVEKEPPYSNVVYYLDDWIDLGRETYLTDIAALDSAEVLGDFSSYATPDGKLPPPPKRVIDMRLGYEP